MPPVFKSLEKARSKHGQAFVVNTSATKDFGTHTKHQGGRNGPLQVPQEPHMLQTRNFARC